MPDTDFNIPPTPEPVKPRLYKYARLQHNGTLITLTQPAAIYSLTVLQEDIDQARTGATPPQPPFPPDDLRLLEPSLGPFHFASIRQYGRWLWQSNAGSMFVSLDVELDTHHTDAAEWLRQFGAGHTVPEVTFLFEKF